MITEAEKRSYDAWQKAGHHTALCTAKLDITDPFGDDNYRYIICCGMPAGHEGRHVKTRKGTTIEWDGMVVSTKSPANGISNRNTEENIITKRQGYCGASTPAEELPRFRFCWVFSD